MGYLIQESCVFALPQHQLRQLTYHTKINLDERANSYLSCNPMQTVAKKKTTVLNPAKYTNSARYRCLENLHKQSLELYLRYCGVEECDADHYYGPTERSEFLLHYIIEGEGIYSVNGQSYSLKKHQAFLIWPGTETFYKADHKNPWKYIWIGFNGTKAEEYLRHAQFSEKNLVNEFHRESELKNCIDSILEVSHLTISNALIRESFLLRFLAILIQENQSLQDKNTHYSAKIYVDHAIEFIEHHFDEKIKITDIAQYIGINRSHLAHCFQMQLQMSPQDYLIQFRIQTASGLLTSTDLPVSSIAARVGYDDPFAFSKIFKKIQGLSPKYFRAGHSTLILSTDKYQ